MYSSRWRASKLSPRGAGWVGAFMAAVGVLWSLQVAAPQAVAEDCLLPENGSGTVDLPLGCPGGYGNVDDFLVITDGLPEWSSIRVRVSWSSTIIDSRTPGGHLGGEIQTFFPVIVMSMEGTGVLDGFSHFTPLVNTFGETHSGGFAAFHEQQTVPMELVRLEGEGPASDTVFSALRYEVGSGLGLPETLGEAELWLERPGVCVGGRTDGAACARDSQCPDSTTNGTCEGGSNDGAPCASGVNCPGGVCVNRGLCVCPGGPCVPHYRSRGYFDVSFAIEYEGRAGGPLEGCFGRSTGTIRMRTGTYTTVFMRPVGGDGREIVIRPGQSVTIEAYVRDTAPKALAGYQVTFPLEASGDQWGGVTYDGNAPRLDVDRPDFVYFGLSPITSAAFHHLPTVLAFFFPPPVGGYPVVEQQRYLGDATYVASTSAIGTFTIDFVRPGATPSAQTSLADEEFHPMAFEDVGAIIHVAPPSCATGCDDGLFCNGLETCVEGECVAGDPPCPAGGLPHCDEVLDACVECLHAHHCDDEDACTDEMCVAGTCEYVLPAAAPFAVAGAFDVGFKARSVAFGDFDADGDADLAVVGSDENRLAILFNHGDGSFAVPRHYVAAAAPYDVVAGDLDGDGDLDLAVSSGLVGELSVSLNDGSGNFQILGHFSVPDPTYRLTLRDLDIDGDLDVVSTNPSWDDVTVLYNSGDGSFLSALSYDVEDGPRSVAAEDFDGDGYPDLAVANWHSDDLAVMLNQGDGTFAIDARYAVGEEPWKVVAADLDGDSHADLAVCHEGSGDVAVLLNESDGLFAKPQFYVAGGPAMGLDTGDVDADGDVDLIVGSRPEDSTIILLNHGDGTFGEPESYLTGDLPSSVNVGDFDLDGDQDVAVANWADRNVVLLRNTPEVCVIEESCFEAGAPSPAFACDVCEPWVSRSEWTPIPGCVEDDCATAFGVDRGVTYAINVGFGPDLVEASCQPDSNHDAWYKYTAPCTARHRISLSGTLFEPSNDTVLSVYDSCDGVEIACDDNGGSGLLSEVTFEAEADARYYIRVAGAGENVGEIALTIDALERCVRRSDGAEPLPTTFR